MIRGAESDSADKTALAVALGGPSGKTWENAKNPKNCKIDIFRLLFVPDA